MTGDGTARAIALVSGGLDSNLAVRLVLNMGIAITGVQFISPFHQTDRGHAGRRNYASRLAEELGFPLRRIELGADYVDIIRNPPHGYGSGANPCMDCRICMLKKAGQLMETERASFIVTGEVVGQRPMSQRRRQLEIIERESGLEGLILRPLCGQLMPETIPEKDGLVQRGRLLSFNGRQRRDLMALAAGMGIGDYPTPGGGCLLTDRSFAARVKDAGMKLSVMVLNGIAGKELSIGHAENTGRTLSRMNADYISFLTVMPVPGTDFYDAVASGSIKLPEPMEVLQEIKIMLMNLSVERGLFFANHASNYLPLKGKLPKDKEQIISLLDYVIRNKREDCLNAEFLRRL